jgi:pyruvyltransferase
MRPPLRVWAWSEGVRNFGDELGPVLLERLGYPIERVDDIGEAGILTCGSLLEHAEREAAPGTIVWGSGLMRGGHADLSHLDVRAVRGPLTVRAAGLDPTTPVGDPAVLVPELWTKPRTVRGLGVVRHYIDKREYSWADAVIDADQPVDEVIEFIGSCRAVASSSLHGLIIAHAWGLDTLRLPHPEVAGADFKWLDWLTSIAGYNAISPKVLP